MKDDIILYNTLKSKKEIFTPINHGEVKMYTCGPTVYNYVHIGNLRTFVFEDILKKMFIYKGYKVLHVMNITDVGHLSDDGDEGEDKMSLASEREKKSVWDVALFYTEQFFKDIDDLNIQRANFYPKATDNIDNIIEFIKVLEKKGYTYTSSGNVYFDTSKVENYYELSKLPKTECSVNRVEIDKAKKNKEDFVLWFTNSKFKNHAMMWDSPFGKGYPGWHIECSAMSLRYLGEHFDIHAGGIDAVRVHHTNEKAQSEAYLSSKWVNYWLHGEFLLSEKGKMSKSSGEFLTLSLLKSKGYSPLSYRYFLLSCHYRKQLQFSFGALESAQKGLYSLYESIDKLKKNLANSNNKELTESYYSYVSEFEEALFNDMNMPVCLAVLHKVIKDDKLSNFEKLEFVKKADSVLSLNLIDNREEISKSNQSSDDIPLDVIELCEKRLQAKRMKDFSLSDSLRDQISALGYIVQDSKDGYKLIKK